MNTKRFYAAQNVNALQTMATLLTACFGVFTFCNSIARGDDKSDHFEIRVRPLFVQKCAECHSGSTPEGNFGLDTADAFRKGGKTGSPVIANNADASLIIQRVVSEDKKLVMPPEQKLTEAEIADLKKWVNDGAHWPDSVAMPQTADDKASHWAFQPVKEVTPPTVANASWCRNPVDQFIAAGHEASGLTPVAAAERRTLIRRATLDLTGLPPKIKDVDVFLADQSPDAFSKVVERLLASPQYGERWGRHWLDLARYADTSGDGTDTPIPEARYYRNYVIQSFNQDLPYNEFLREQIAGDILAKQDPSNLRVNDRIIATGYIALSRRFANSAFAEMNLIIDDTIDTIGKSTLGLTLGCARCHHHKFDPVTTNDYYGLYGYFENTQYPHAGTEHQKERQFFVSMQKNEAWPKDYESLEAWAVSDKKDQTGDTKIRIAGDIHKKGEIARRGYLSALSSEFPEIPAGNSGRLEFANWLASDSNVLTTRVIVNRVWQYHFGRGIVESSSNFGLQGSKPTHPALLDWLAADFVKNGWSIKHLHRLIMNSATYQLSSAPNDENLRKDEGNKLLWRFDRRRMDAETIRDSLLFVSHQLQDGDGGRHPFKPTPELKYNQGNPFDDIFDHKYRSVYLMTPRLTKHPFMALFDGADPNKTTENRRESIVALQALYLMNSPFVKETAAAFSTQLTSSASDTDARIQAAWQTTLSRPATDEELNDARSFVFEYRQQMMDLGKSESEADQLAWASFSRSLLSSNEFLFVD